MNGFVSGPNEPGLEHFSQWLDHQVRRSSNARGGILGGIIGTSWGLTGGAIGVIGGGFHVQNAWLLLGLIPGVVGTAWGLAWYFKKRSDEEKALDRMQNQSRGLLWRLQNARWRSNLRSLLGPKAGELLEEGARHWVRASAAFTSPVWSATAMGSAHLDTRDHAQHAMDSAMMRLTLLAGIGRYEEGPSGPAHKIVDDMRQMADEAQSLMEKLGERTVVETSDGSQDLRAALGELRMLSQAEDELRELKEGDHPHA